MGTKARHETYQQEIKHFYWSFVYMKLYNNSQKTPQSESLHKVKLNCKTPHQKMKVYTANITVSGPLWLRAIWQEKTPQTVLRDYRENFHAQNTQAGSWYTQKATRIFLQHQILILYTALFLKGQSGFSIRENLVTQRAWSAFSRGRFFSLCWLYLHALVGNCNTRGRRAWRCTAGNNGFLFSTSLSAGFCNAALLLQNSLMCLFDRVISSTWAWMNRGLEL